MVLPLVPVTPTTVIDEDGSPWKRAASVRHGRRGCRAPRRTGTPRSSGCSTSSATAPALDRVAARARGRRRARRGRSRTGCPGRTARESRSIEVTSTSSRRTVGGRGRELGQVVDQAAEEHGGAPTASWWSAGSSCSVGWSRRGGRRRRPSARGRRGRGGRRRDRRRRGRRRSAPDLPFGSTVAARVPGRQRPTGAPAVGDVGDAAAARENWRRANEAIFENAGAADGAAGVVAARRLVDHDDDRQRRVLGRHEPDEGRLVLGHADSASV